MFARVIVRAIERQSAAVYRKKRGRSRPAVGLRFQSCKKVPALLSTHNPQRLTAQTRRQTVLTQGVAKCRVILICLIVNGADHTVLKKTLTVDI